MFRKLLRLWRVARAEVLVLWYACRHPATPRAVKLGALLLALYVVSPVDAISDLLPFAGWVDDLALLAFGVPWLLDRVPPVARQDAQRRVGSLLARWMQRATGR